MIEQIQTFDSNALAIEVIDGFTTTDEALCQKFFEEKLKKGYQHINVLIKLNELKLSKSSTKAFFEDSIWSLRHLKQLGNIAIVGHSNIVKSLVPIDNFFFERLGAGYEERYFDKSQMQEALQFITTQN